MKRGSCYFVVFLMVLLFSFQMLASEPFMFEQRVKAQEAIDRVYYDNRIWPADNPGPKPLFESVVDHKSIVLKVSDYIKKNNALETAWHVKISPADLQGEIDRMVRNSKDRALLDKLFAALNNDPALIAECLARPVLVDRRIRSMFSADVNIHSEARILAAKNLESFQRTGVILDDSCANETLTFVKEGSERAREGSELEDSPAKVLPPGVFDSLGADYEIVGRAFLNETANDFEIVIPLSVSEEEIVVRNYYFPKKDFDGWWSEASKKAGASLEGVQRDYDYKVAGSGPQPEAMCPDNWLDTSLDDIPDPRYDHKAVWTGTEMIIWGGGYNSGARYNPGTDTWTPISRQSGVPSPRTNSTAVWTGTEMIIWGGYLYDTTAHYYNTGGRYNPTTDAWTATSTGTNCPTARRYHTAAWSGTEMLIWGGETSSSVITNTGSRYTPSPEGWTAMSTTSAPVARRYATSVYLGGKFIVWGGSIAGDVRQQSGGVYDLAGDTWAATSTGANVPAARRYHTAVATASEMIIWGGEGVSSTALNSGARYNPVGDSWTAVNLTGAPDARMYHTAALTATDMIIWGGKNGTTSFQTGAKYNLAGDSWTATNTTGAPTARYQHTAVWAGTATPPVMIVWGGYYPTNTGGRYNPDTDSWTATSLGTNVPQGRQYHTAVWTGSEMIVWGGEVRSNLQLNTGGKYTPATDSWTATSTDAPCPVARRYHTAVWNGTKMIIWGGNFYDGSENQLDTGGLYNPGTDGWTATSISADASARQWHTAVWTGTEMIIWGGLNGSSSLNTGARYSPGADTWTATSVGTSLPTARYYHTAVWTGGTLNTMIIWGGTNGATTYATGGNYNAGSDTWTATASSGAPALRYWHTAVWAEQIKSMVVWGGYNGNNLNTGGILKFTVPTSAWAWTATSTSSAPAIRKQHSAVWTGEEMIAFGGEGPGNQYKDDGGRLTAYSNGWTALSQDPGFPTPRSLNTAVWTGRRMIVWGGSGAFSSGGIYEPPPQVTGYYEACSGGSVTLSRYSSRSGICDVVSGRAGICNVVPSGGDSTVTNTTAGVYFTAADVGKHIIIDSVDYIVKTFVDPANITIDEEITKSVVTWSMDLETTVTSTTSGAYFTASDVGKHIIIDGQECHVKAFVNMTTITIEEEVDKLAVAWSMDEETYQWLKDGGEIAGAIGQTYKATESGDYNIRMNGTCEGVPHHVDIWTNPAPVITGSSSGCSNPGVILDAGATYSTYQWIRDGVDIAGATAKTYTATLIGTYNYTIRVTENHPLVACTGTSALPFVLTIYENPVPVIYGALEGACPTRLSTQPVRTGICDVVSGGGDSVVTNTTAGVTFRAADVGKHIIIDGVECHIKAYTDTTHVTIDEEVNKSGVTWTITDTAYASYQWKLGSTIMGTDPTYLATANGSYTVVVTDVNGCVGTSAAYVVSNYPVPVINANPTSGCVGSIVTLSTTISYSSYQWYKDTILISGATNPTYGATVTGSYTVQVTDAMGCPGLSPTAKAVTFYALPTPVISGDHGPACSSTLTTTTTFNSYQWYKDGTLITGAISQNYTATLSGNYTVTVTQTHGTGETCVGTSAEFSVTIWDPPEPPTVLGPSSGCSESGVTLSTGTYASYQWYVNQTLIPGANSQTYLTTQTGFNYYTVSIVDSHGCTASTSAGLWVNLDPPRPEVRTDQDNYWITDGNVNALAESGTTLYIGGDFGYVGPYTGSGPVIDSSSGTRVASWPKINGTVYAIAPDGAGGFYFGGSFTKVGGYTRQNLVHLKSDKSVDQDFAPAMNGIVYSLLVQGTNVYVGGNFTTINNYFTRNRLAAFDSTTGQLTAWNPNISSSGAIIYSLAYYDGKVYVGGSFTAVAGATYNRLVAIDSVTGLATTWNPNIGGIVRAVRITGTKLFIGGDFTTCGGATYNHLAAYDLASGSIISTWNPNVNGNVYAIDVYGDTVYVGGLFTWITNSGTVRNHIAALDATKTAAPYVTFWDPKITGASGVNVTSVKVSAAGTTIFAGGFFNTVGGTTTRINLTAIDSVSGAPGTFDPVAETNPTTGNTSVRALALDASNLAVGGDFSSLNGYLRNRLASIDMTTGQATSWDPNIYSASTASINALAVAGTALYAGGAFSKVGGSAGTSKANIASFDIATGNLNSWNGNSGSVVRCFHVSGSTLYVGGDFTTMAGSVRNRLASFELTTGDLNGWNPSVNDGSVYSIAVSGSTLYAGGSFTKVNSTTVNRNRLAALETGSSALLAWNAGLTGNSVRAIVAASSLVYIGGDFTVAGGQNRNRLAAISASTALATAWDPNMGGIVYALSPSLDGTILYAGGAFTTVGGVTYNRLAAIDTTSGLPSADWNPGADAQVSALLQKAPVMFMGGVFTTLRSIPRYYLGAAQLMGSCGSGISLSTDTFASYQWYKDSTILDGATSQAYTASQAGLYKVRVTRTGGCAGESSELRTWISSLGTPTITSVVDADACAQSGVTITWGAVSGATGYDLYVDATTLVATVTSPYVYNPGDTSAHGYQVRAKNASCTGSYSTSVNGTDANGQPSTPVISSVVDNSAVVCDGVVITFTTGAPATQHDLYIGAVLVQANITSPYLYVPGDSLAHTYIVRAVNGTCYADSVGVAGTDLCGSPCAAPSAEVTDDKPPVGDKTQFTWTAIAADHVKVVRGIQGNLAALETSAEDFTCYASALTTSVNISGDDPSGVTGRCYYYLIAGYNCSDSSQYVGPYGLGKGAVQRIVNQVAVSPCTP